MCDSSMLRNDLLSLSEEKFFIKYIAKSNYWYFTEYLRVPQDQILDKIDLLKEIISPIGRGCTSSEKRSDAVL